MISLLSKASTCAFNACCYHEPDYLLPFFGNNKLIDGYFHKNPNCVIKEDYVHDKMVARTNKLHFVHKVHIDDNLSMWNENYFSLRLVNYLMKYPIVPGTFAEYTAREGQQFGKLEDAKYFIFHGSPDIILRKVEINEHVVVVNKGQEGRTG